MYSCISSSFAINTLNLGFCFKLLILYILPFKSSFDLLLSFELDTFSSFSDISQIWEVPSFFNSWEMDVACFTLA